MKIGIFVDQNGLYVCEAVDGNEIPPNLTLVTEPSPDGFYKSKWNGSAWVEGLTQAEIDEIVNRPVPKTPQEKEIDQLRTQLSNQNDANTAFMEFVLSTLGV